MKKKPKIIIIIGPTAVGKTKYAIKLAETKNGEIISADSMQVYKKMDIGTAKPTKKEQQGIKHYLLSIKNPDQSWTVADFIFECRKKIKAILKKGKLPIIVGGTGLYINALLQGFSFPIIEADLKYRKKLYKRAEKQGSPKLHEELQKIDPYAAKKIHPHDLKRIIRALEVFHKTGQMISQVQTKNPLSNEYDIQIKFLDMPREKLYARINHRVGNMIKKGLIKEVKKLKAKGYDKNLPSMQGLGYKEIFDYLDNKTTKEAAIDLIKQKTRNFARRQLVWFRRILREQ